MAVQAVETEKIENTGDDSLEELQARLDASPEGLDQTEVQNRLRRYGYNEISEKKVNPFLKLLTYFRGPIPWMIEAAAVLSAAVRQWLDFTIIMILLPAMRNERIKVSACRVLNMNRSLFEKPQFITDGKRPFDEGHEVRIDAGSMRVKRYRFD